MKTAQEHKAKDGTEKTGTEIHLSVQDETPVLKRNRILSEKNITYETTRNAWFTLSHMLLPAESRVVHTGCGNGDLTFAMAALRPDLYFIGLDKNRRYINQAKSQYELPNLEFRIGDATSDVFPAGSIDAIINRNVLHVIYSGSSYNPQIVNETLATQFTSLKAGGLMYIFDYARPPPNEYVLLELPDKASTGDNIAGLSEADLLVWYAEHARPKQDAGFGGFFLEELPPRLPHKRLFRLPYKWAYEFLLRKDDREKWTTELPMEYMFFTPWEYRQQLRNLGARVVYSAPHWNEDYIQKNFEGKIRLFDDRGAPLGDPPTSFVAVAVKMDDRKSLRIEERRPTQSGETTLRIQGMRNNKTGDFIDVVSRDEKFNEIIPYRIDENGQLKIWLHDGVARSIVGAVPRSGTNIDGKEWSGHMVEAISINAELIEKYDTQDPADTVRFGRDHIGLKPKSQAILRKGPDYYPAPEYIDERIYTYYLDIKKTNRDIPPKPAIDHSGRFHAKGKLREFDAQSILDCIAVGMIPNARLELQILSLFEHLSIKSENWIKKDFHVQKAKITRQNNVGDLLKKMGNNTKRFQETKGTAGQLRPIHSTFVEEGQSNGNMTGLSAQDIDFIVHNEKTINTAVVLPIILGMKNDLHAGFLMEHMPVPQRYEGNSNVIAAPSFTLPPEVTNLKMVKKFLAEKFGVLPDMVIKLGESYYSHIGITPQKIHPFAVAAPPEFFADPQMQFLPFYQLMLLQKRLKTDAHFMITVARSFRMMHDDIKFDLARRATAIVNERFMDVKPDWGLPLDYHSAPVDKPVFGENKTANAALTSSVQAQQPQAQNKAQKNTPSTTRDTRDHTAEPPTTTNKMVQNSTVQPFHARTHDDLSEEMDEFIEILKEAAHNTPKPEKW